MGYKCEVDAWCYIAGDEPSYDFSDYAWMPLYRGKSWFKAYFVAWRNRRKYGCVKLELRL